ncbi:hypothetical protein [Conexibacter woesei]|uniref:Uncharacterized protein n=1 Tax=Conexibacter woesei (strain DSM 14684 / CCUG 47730 / CIP 108061 / JCM 11494 / NBRC 100937 / ID131577) TaxID=469383 RepID=D3EYY9_CONWI|nr:hypothetical protein [Conexibacter woesei]ADB49863.1 hypothetical protein Cwoe_1435 [Conexibacter woesei DSM 14684]
MNDDPPPAAARLRLALELDPNADPLRGRLVSDDGSVREFTGWLEFARAIEEAAAPRSGG